MPPTKVSMDWVAKAKKWIITPVKDICANRFMTFAKIFPDFFRSPDYTRWEVEVEFITVCLLLSTNTKTVAIINSENSQNLIR